MPTSRFIRWRPDENEKQFIPDSRDKYISAFNWLNYLNSHGANIRHKLNAGNDLNFHIILICDTNHCDLSCYNLGFILKSPLLCMHIMHLG